MTTEQKTDLDALIERVKGAKEPSRELDKAIYATVNGKPEIAPDGQYGWRENEQGWHYVDGSDARTMPKCIIPDFFSASVGPAIGLAERVFGSTAIDIEIGHRRVGGKLYGRAEICGPNVDSEMQHAATPALALVLAVLTALRARDGSTNGR